MRTNITRWRVVLIDAGPEKTFQPHPERPTRVRERLSVSPPTNLRRSFKIPDIRVRLVQKTLISMQYTKRKRRQRSELPASNLPSERQLGESARIGRDVTEVG